LLPKVTLSFSLVYRLGMLDECFIYLKECLKIISIPNFYKENTVASRMRQLRQECKLKL
jgi:hypothetical protein